MVYTYSWIEKRTNGNEKNQITVLYNNPVPRTIELIHNHINQIVPPSDIVVSVTLCRLLTRLPTEQNIHVDAAALFMSCTSSSKLFERLAMHVMLSVLITGQSSSRCGVLSGGTVSSHNKTMCSTIMSILRRGSFRGVRSAQSCPMSHVVLLLTPSCSVQKRLASTS